MGKFENNRESIGAAQGQTASQSPVDNGVRGAEGSMPHILPNVRSTLTIGGIDTIINKANAIGINYAPTLGIIKKVDDAIEYLTRT